MAAINRMMVRALCTSAVHYKAGGLSMKKLIVILSVMIVASAASVSPSHAERREIQLAKPNMKGGVPLMLALSKRQSSRSFSTKAIPDQVLSNLLWAANGVNRADSGKRTAPSAVNKQEIDIYVAMVEGLYLYSAAKHALILIAPRDIRALTGRQGFVKNAALNLVFVADMSNIAGNDREDKLIYAGADTGFIGQNVYLFCASEGLSTVIRGYIDRDALAKAMNLKSTQMIILSQTVGYPGN
jgi:SagB-type dehydrogenase family enzyme